MPHDKLTIKRISTLHPVIRDRVLKAYKKANNKLGKYVRLRISQAYRSPKYQRELYLKRPKVTNADSWQSIHNYGLAFDIVILYDNDKNGTFEEASWNTERDGDFNGFSDWLTVTSVFEDYGFKNGFWSNGKKWDKPHFQDSLGYKWRGLKSIIDKGMFFTEVINKIEYKYPMICKK